MSLRSSLSSLRKLKSPEGNKRASSVGILASIDAILDRESTANSIDSLDDESDDCESIPEDGDIVPPPPNAELAKQLMSPPKPSPGVLKRKSTGRMGRTKLLKDSKKTSSSMSAIDALPLSSEDDDESLLLSPPITPGGTKKRKSKKKNMLQALQESADTLPPFQFEGEEKNKKSSPRTLRRASMGALTTTTTSSSSGAVADDDNAESPSLRARRKTLSSSLHSDMVSSIRKTRSTKVETSSRRGKRTADGEGSSRRARRSMDASKSKKGDGSSSTRSKRTVEGNDDAAVASSLRSSRKSTSGTSGETASSIRRERSSLKSSSSGSVKSSSKKKKTTKKTSTTKKSKRRSAESYGSTATSKTADLDESWNSLREESQRSGLSEESQDQHDFAAEEGEYELKEEEEEEEEEEEIQNEFELILEEEEEREYELPLPDDDNAVESMFNDSFHYMGKDQGQSSTSSLDLSDDDDDDEAQVIEQKKKELPRFLGHASLGAIDYNPFEVSEDEDEALLQDADDDDNNNNDELKEETVARPPSSNRRSSVRDSGTSKRGLSCGPIKARGREEERSNSKRGFSVSPTREVNLEAMMGFQRPLLSCMKGSRMKLLSVKLKNPHVYFNECLVITPIIPTYELAAKKSDLWFKQKDFDKILNRSMAIALRVKEGKKTRKCTRGLEHFLKDKEERYAAWNAVLVEQEIQKLRASHSDEKISELYLAASTTCRTEAQERAQEDYDAIVKYILED